MPDKEDTPVNLDDSEIYKMQMYKAVKDHGHALAAIKGGIGVCKWIIPSVIVLVGTLLAFIYKGDMASLNARLDKIVHHLNIEAQTADIDKPETNTP